MTTILKYTKLRCISVTYFHILLYFVHKVQLDIVLRHYFKMASTVDNDNKTLNDAIVATTTAITTAVSAVAAVFATAANNGQSNQSPNAKRCSNKTIPWYAVENNDLYDKGWYHDQFCCSKKSFDAIHKQLKQNCWMCSLNLVITVFWYQASCCSCTAFFDPFGVNGRSCYHFWDVVEFGKQIYLAGCQGDPRSLSSKSAIWTGRMARTESRNGR